ncbi:MAG: helix-turn-helix transcriptional regulator [Planctomycetes bacterium]|nr:helix-turn-helix transcriptional regulator [Planctomycetota bacterium]
MNVQTIQLEGKRFVVVEEGYFRRLRRRAGEGDDLELPPLPKPDTEGRILAIEYARASIARDIIRERKSLGLSQEHLAKLAGIRQETLSRIETGKHTPTARVVSKIDHALQKFRKWQATSNPPRKTNSPSACGPSATAAAIPSDSKPARRSIRSSR